MTKTQAKSAIKRAYAAFAAESMVFLIAYLAIIVGVPILIDPSTFAPASVQTGLSDLIVRFWGADLLAGGVLSASGLITEKPRLERAGLILLAAGAFIYAMLIVFSIGWAGLLPALTYALFSISSLARFAKLGKVIEGIETAQAYTDVSNKIVMANNKKKLR